MFYSGFFSSEAFDKRTNRVSVTNGAIVIHTQRLKSDPGGNLLS
ncbi:integrase [Escherichia coli]|nr:integrase [Escherichia coli]